MRWRAFYADGTLIEQRPGAYQAIDRAKLTEFVIDRDGGPILFRVQRGRRLVWRMRRRLVLGASEVQEAFFVALESPQRARVDAWWITERGEPAHSARYGSDARFRMPDLEPQEVPCLAR
jgi:hypothetical protein